MTLLFLLKKYTALTQPTLTTEITAHEKEKTRTFRLVYLSNSFWR